METRIISFPKRRNKTGDLTFLEAEHEIPFAIKRIYYIYDVAHNARRGFHAHKKLQQVLICVHGSCKILLNDGEETTVVELNNPSEGLLIDSAIWREMYDFSPGAVLLVLASEYYDESDYIREYKAFLDFLEENRN